MVASFVSDLRGAAPISAIHPRDEMYLYNLESLRGSRDCAAILYFLKGYQIFQTVSEIVHWRFHGFEGVRSFLDFASGYGRSTRFLVRELSPARISVSEILPGAVQFQHAAFGVGGVVSAADPTDFSAGGTFTCILASSFFSHLPKATFGSWLKLLFGLLESGGSLIFSVHGDSLYPQTGADWSDGIIFLPESESRKLDREQYGTSYVTERFVRDAVDNATEGGAQLRCFPNGFCAYQDLYVLVKDMAADLSGLELTSFPRGDLDRLEIPEEGWISLAGWAVGGSETAPLEEVRLIVGNDVVDRWKPPVGPGSQAEVVSKDGSGASRWLLQTERERVSLDDVVMVKAVNRRCFENILAMGTLRPLVSSRS